MCKCSPSQIQKYQRKLSGPLIDRIDLFLEVPQLKFEKLIKEEDEGLSTKIREKVKRARVFQKERFKKDSNIRRKPSLLHKAPCSPSLFCQSP